MYYHIMVSWLTSTVLMGVAVVAVGWLTWHRGWADYSPAGTVSRTGEPGRLSEDPRALGVAFAALVLAAIGGVVTSLSGPGPMVATAVVAGAGTRTSPPWSGGPSVARGTE